MVYKYSLTSPAYQGIQARAIRSVRDLAEAIEQNGDTHPEKVAVFKSVETCIRDSDSRELMRKMSFIAQEAEVHWIRRPGLIYSACRMAVSDIRDVIGYLRGYEDQ